MIGKVKDIIMPDGEDFALAMIAVSLADAAKLWERYGEDVVIAWVVGNE